MSLAVEIPVDDRFVGLVRHLAAQAARRAELSEDRVDDVKLAVTELVSNALEAQRRLGVATPVRVEIRIADPFEVRVLDRGDGLELPLRRGSLKSPQQGGLGLMITQALVDGLVVSRRDGGGSAVAVSMSRHPTTEV